MEKNSVMLLEKNYMKTKKIIFAKMEKFRGAENIGILVSSKQGQFSGNYMKIADMVARAGKKPYIIIMDCITNDKLMGLRIDFFINTFQ